MERRKDSQNQWMWVGGVPVLLFLFLGKPEDTGLFFIVAMTPAALSILFAFALLKIIIGMLSSATKDAMGHFAATLRPKEFLRNVNQTQFPARQFYHAKPQSM